MTDDRAEHWYYQDKEIRFSFSKEDDWKLNTITVNSDAYRFNDLIFIGQAVERVKWNLKKLRYLNLDFEDWATSESPDHQLLTIDELNMNFWFDHNELSELQWSPFFKDEETIIWPIIEQRVFNESLDNSKKYTSLHPFGQLGLYLENWLDQLFWNKTSKEYLELFSKLPEDSKREDLLFVNKFIQYEFPKKNKSNWMIKAEVSLDFKEEYSIGRISVIWDKHLEIIKQDFLFD